MKRLIFIFAILFISLLFGANNALATTIFSPLIEMEVEPGESQSGVVKIYNETDESLFLVSSVEAFTSGDESGQPEYLPEISKYDYLKWFNVEQDSVILTSI